MMTPEKSKVNATSRREDGWGHRHPNSPSGGCQQAELWPRETVAAGKQSERQFVPLPTFALGLRDRDSTGQQNGGGSFHAGVLIHEEPRTVSLPPTSVIHCPHFPSFYLYIQLSEQQL